ncbi:hypothetical protein CAEBREN_25639 [Caenorhabditis brenneri]|uniref:ADP-ribosylation factor-like protein 6 n=1 Tax=Caenorhabditis brenneri TaxID=135651 RepID=G0MEG7_CAEBE|nr:hypothetical protein CAEBREN_25639 [Caenorhabditis brenneri]
MGFLSSLSNLFGMGKKDVNIVVVGLDNSGKTTILNHLKTPETRSQQIVPTVGHVVTNFSTQNLSFHAFDMAGQMKYRSTWESYFHSSQGVIFVLDSSDRLRMELLKDELWMVLDHKEVSTRGIPVAILANKMDIPGAMTAADITTALGLNLHRSGTWFIHSTCALTGDGLDKAMQQLSTEIMKYMESRRS